MPTIAIVNQKGGSAKTAFALHTIFRAVGRKQRTLAIDFDKQASLTRFFNAAADDGQATSAQCFEGPITAAPVKCGDYLDFLPADRALRLCSGAGAEAAVQAAENVRELAAHYDVVIIDTPGALGEDATTYAALLSANSVLVPFAVGSIEANALADLWECIEAIREQNAKLRVLGLLPSRINTRSSIEVDALRELREAYGALIVPHTLTDRSAVKQAIAQGVPVWRGTKGDGHLKAAREWGAACDWVLDNAQEIAA
ncbi:ParA family protein [Paraburkholderia tropica]|uniref:ParA family protein n=1 Tax=Paraburkholderia tropica TaxID=92647 RepID=UPI002AB7BA6F|nr:ParA family protein [Paraburkholderia tropica]